MTRLSDLRAASTLAVMRNLPGRCHELKGGRQGQFALTVAGGRRLVIEPADGWPETEEGSDPWAAVDTIRVLEIVDYHDG
jgi:proteic killer suppression protein